MSAFARVLIALIGVLSGLAFLSLPFMVHKYDLGALGLGVGLAAVCFLLAIAMTGGNFGRLAGRILGGVVFLAYLGYIVVEFYLPQRPLSEWRRSDASLLSATLGFLVIGLPAGYYSIKGQLGAANSVGNGSDGELEDEDAENEDVT